MTEEELIIQSYKAKLAWEMARYGDSLEIEGSEDGQTWECVFLDILSLHKQFKYYRLKKPKNKWLELNDKRKQMAVCDKDNDTCRSLIVASDPSMGFYIVLICKEKDKNYTGVGELAFYKEEEMEEYFIPVNSLNPEDD